MHTRLEQYLDAVAAGLGPLPPARREDELREVRQHLENAVFLNREMGMGEDEAAAAAVEQCGPPAEAAEGLVRAWRRGERLRRRDFWGAAACTVVLWHLLPERIGNLVHPVEGVVTAHLFPALAPHDPVRFLSGAAAYAAMECLTSYLLIGAVTGLLFPRRAVAGTALVTAGWLALQFQVMMSVLLSGPLVTHWWRFVILTAMAETTLMGLTAVAAAALASRCRSMRQRPTTAPIRS